MDEYKTINVHLFRPAFKNVKQRCEVLSCNACDSCDMYKQGKCVVKEYLLMISDVLMAKYIRKKVILTEPEVITAGLTKRKRNMEILLMH